MSALRHAPLLAAIALGAAGCSPTLGGPTCVPGGCAAPSACVIGRCRPADAAPVSADATRLVLAPTAIAVVSSGGGGGGDALPEAFTLGRAADGRVVLLLRFEPIRREGAVVERAFLVLDPLEGAPPPTGAATIDVSRIGEPWDPAIVSYGRIPRIDVPARAGVAPPRPAPAPRPSAPAPAVGPAAAAASLASARAPLRVEVTELVRADARGRSSHGLALTAVGDDAVGATFTTGLSRGRAPRLEVFVQ
jgi:hypothetical protein